VKSLTPDHSGILELADRKGRVCGHVMPNDFGLMQTSTPVEIMLLSESRKPLLQHVGGDQMPPWESDDRKEYPHALEQWCFYWALLISWDNGIAERRGLCVVHKKAAAWSYAPGVNWKEITLG
jgi:hypothetical protein